MSSSVGNQILKYGVVAIEEALLTSGEGAGDSTAIPVSCYTMSATPFVAGQEYVIQDASWGAGANGLPNAERFILSSISGAVATPQSDGLGYHYTATLVPASALANSYSTANAASVLIPGVEMVPQSADFNCRFKTISDAPKIDPDDEASRIATGDEGRDFSIMGARSTEINFTEKLAYAGSYTALPVWDKLARSSGHLRRSYTTTGIGYKPHTWSNEVTATIWMVTPENGFAPNSTVYRYVGCHGNLTISAGKIGDPFMITGKYMGAYVGTQDITNAQARSFTSNFTTIPEVLLNDSVTVPSWVASAPASKTIQISQFTLDPGSVINPYVDQTTSTGYAYYVTSDRDCKLTLNPYHYTKAMDDVDYVVSNNITGQINIKSPHMTIEVCNAQLMQPTLASREGYVNTERSYRALRNNLGSVASDSTVADSLIYEVLIGQRS